MTAVFWILMGVSVVFLTMAAFKLRRAFMHIQRILDDLELADE